MIKITNKKELVELLENIDWHDSFIREVYVQSPSYISDDSYMIAPDAKWSMKIMIILRDQSIPAIEFLFEGVDNIFLTSIIDIEPEGKIENNQVFFYMNKGCAPIVAQNISYNIHDKKVIGYINNYSYNNLFEKDGFPRWA